MVGPSWPDGPGVPVPCAVGGERSEQGELWAAGAASHGCEASDSSLRGLGLFSGGITAPSSRVLEG